MKKLYTTLLSLVLILSIGLSTVSAANITAKDLSEMDLDYSSDLYDGVSLLMGLGILKDTDTFPVYLGEGITRSHFLEFVMRFSVDGEYSVSEQTLPFKDVLPSASYYGALKAAVDGGIIMPDENFRPNDYITYEEALTVMFRVYGLDAILDNSLPWPQNYIKLATNMKLYKGNMILDHDGYLTYEGFFKLMKDMLGANVVEAHYSTAGIEYTISDDKYHEIWYDVYELEGLVEANSITNISSNAPYKEGYLLIGGEYYYSGSDYQTFLGYDVEGYYRKDDLNTIISLSKKQCKELVINAQDIEGVSLSGDIVKIKYDDNGKMKDAQISTSASVIYNGKSFADDRFYVEWYNISNGSITLVTKNGSTYDIAFINEYESYVVTAVDSEENVIYVKDSEPVALENVDLISITDAEGRKLALEEIVKDNVISLKKAYDNSSLEIIVSDKYFTAVLNSIDSSEKTLYFGAEAYSASTELISSVKLGTTYGVYVDAFGFLADCVSISDSDIAVAYVIAWAHDSFPKKVSVLMLKNGDEEPQEHELADKVEIDGKRYKLADIISEAQKDDPSHCPLFSGNTQPMEMIRYKFNTTGKISFIDTSAVREDEDETETLDKRYTGASLALKDRKFGDSSSSTAGVVGPKSFLGYDSTNTLVVNVPADPTNYDEYEIITNLYNGSYTLDLYTQGTEAISALGAVVSGQSNAANIDDEDTLYVIARVAFALKDDEWVRRITVARNGVETDIYVDPKDEQNGVVVIPNDLAIGDAVSYKVDFKNYVNAFEKYFDYKTTTAVHNYARFNGSIRISAGYIYNYDNSFMGVTAGFDPANISATNLDVQIKPSSGYIYEVSGRELIYEAFSPEKIVTYESSQAAATISIAKLGYEVTRGVVFYKGQPGSDDSYGNLKATFYEKTGAAASSTLVADSSGNIIIPENMFANGQNKFMGWSDGRDVFAPGATYPMTNYNVSFYPVWETSYRHTFVSGDPNATGEAPLDIWEVKGESITIPENTFTNIGFKFMGWSDGTNLYNSPAEYLVKETDVVFTAVWQPARTATFKAPSSDYTGAVAAIGESAGEEITLPENGFTYNGDVKVGTYEFKGWKLVGDPTDHLYLVGDDFEMPDRNVEFTAKFVYKGGTASVTADASVANRINADGTQQLGYNINNYHTLGDQSSDSGSCEMYISFDISQLGELKNISTVELALYYSKVTRGGDVTVYDVTNWDGTIGTLSLTSGSWTDASSEIKTMPTQGQQLYLQKWGTSSPENSYVPVDITAFIKAQAAAGKTKITLKITNNVSNGNGLKGIRMYSAGKSGYEPKLTITTTDDISE